MTNHEPVRNKCVRIYFSESEKQAVLNIFSQSTKRNLGEYIRSILLNKPITFFTRSKSLDDFLDEIIILRKEFSALEADFHQMVKHMDHLSLFPEVHDWIRNNEKSKDLIFRKIEDIENKINEIDCKWLP